MLIVGVGGQGVLTAGRALGEAALAAGLDVRVGQLHGMSQRGGSVASTVVIGAGRGAFIPEGGADVLLALEPLEALRARPRVGPSTIALVSRRPITPTPMTLQGVAYPDVDGVLAEIRAAVGRLVVLDGPVGGDLRGLNVWMLGALASLGVLPLPVNQLRAACACRPDGSERRGAGSAFDAGWPAPSGGS